MIQHGYSGWEEMVPTYVDTLIKEKHLFGFDESKQPDADFTPVQRVKYIPA
jgi:hypothetical protein